MDAGYQQEGFDQLRNGWRWWVNELSAIVPARVKNFFTPHAQRLLVTATANSLRFELHAGEDMQEIGELALLDAPSSHVDALLQKLDDSLTAKPTVVFVPSEDAFVSRTVFMPLAVEHNLANVLHYEIDKLTPHKKGEVRFGYRVLQRHPEQEKLAVELHAIAREQLSPYLDKLRNLMLTPSAVIPPNGSQQFANVESLNLLPPAERSVDEPLWNAEVRRGALIAGALLLAALALPAWYLEHSIEEMDILIEEKRLEANQVAEKRGLVTSHLLAQQAITAQKNNMPAKLELLLEITRILPKNTWASRMRIDREKVLLQGESGKASDLIELLEQSEMFKNVRFKSSITYDPRTKDERYEIEMELVGVGQ